MKKLMFAAVAAAMIGGVEAAGYVECFGVYDFSASLKTTKGVKATLKAKSNACLAEGTYFVRKQASVSLCGIIWGCDCESIATPAEFTGFRYNGEGPYDGSAFWNKTDKQGYDVFGDDAVNTLSWSILNRIDTTAKKVEGLWTLELAYEDQNGDPVTSFILTGAGFGTADGEIVGECGNSHVYVKNISGYAVGTRYYTCGEDGEASVAPCEDPGVKPHFDQIWWELCDCADGQADTIAYGSWSIKFNQSASNKGAKYAGMNENVYKFPEYILPQLKAYGYISEECEAAQEALKNAKDVYAAAKSANDAAIARVNTAKEGVEDVTFESLTKQIAAAKATLQAASNSLAATAAAYGVTNAIYIASKGDYNDQMEYTTNGAWTVSYINGSQQEAVVTGTGLAKFDACIEELKFFSFKKIEYVTAERKDYADAKKFVAEQNAKTDALKAKMDAAKADRDTAKAAYDAAKQAVAFGEQAVKTAEYRLENITKLQAQAQAELNAAESAQAQTQAALNTATTAVATAQIAVNNLCD